MTDQVRTTIVVRPLGSGLPLGFFAFGVGMLLLAGHSLGWSTPAEGRETGTLLVAFVFPLEFLAAVIAFLARDTAGATSLGVFAGSWLASGWTLLDAQPGATSHAFGLFLLTFSTMVVMLAVAAFASKPFFTILLGVAALRGVFGGAYELGAGKGWDTASGVIGVGICAVAAYGGLALLLEDAERREVLPLFRRGAAARALEGDLTEQLQRLESEAGVRQQL